MGPRSRVNVSCRPLLLVMLLTAPCFQLHAQAPPQTNTLESRVQQVTAAMARAQAQLEDSQRQLDELRQQLSALQAQIAQSAACGPGAHPCPAASQATTAAQSVSATAPPSDAGEHQAMQDAAIATLDQSKIGSESRYPVKVSGMLLLNGFVNTKAVDMPATPTLAIGGPGSTGATVRQTVLGIDASGPHLWGARSYADVRVDFDGTSSTSTNAGGYSGLYSDGFALLRLRTAHAGLDWGQTHAYFALDRPLISPDSPSSLAAVAEPALAWSGNLWTWNPQVGVTEDIALQPAHTLRLQTALIDTGSAPASYIAPSTAGNSPPTEAEASRWPGLEARVAMLGSAAPGDRDHIGIGGYFAPHHSSLGSRYNSWAVTLDQHFRLPARLQLTSSVYRGLALGGLGGGAYKDYSYRLSNSGTEYYSLPLDDIGGWAQLQEKWSQRLAFNAAFGMDEVFAHELRSYLPPGATAYQSLARNRTFTGNVIFAPSAYLLFSVEYRHLASAPAVGLDFSSNILGLAAAYKF
jgi:hypothetical protein